MTRDGLPIWITGAPRDSIVGGPEWSFFVLLLLIKPCYEPVRFDFLTLIVNHSDFKVALDGISAHGAGPAFRIELACFFSTENQILLFRKAQKVSQNTKRTRWEA